MLDSISKFFERCLKADNNESPDNSEHRLHLASAALLMELCCADQQVSNEEVHELRKILTECFQLDKEELETLWKLAQSEVSNATSLYQFTSLINEHYDHPAKVQLLQNMWRIAYADGRIDRYEEHTIRKVSDLLYLDHKDFIRSKQLARPEE